MQTVLLPLNQNLEKINRSDIYEEEQSKNELDYVNLLYVAFTRAVAGLFIIGEVSDDNTKDKISNYLISYLKDKHLWKENEFIYEFGQLPEPNQGQAENKVIELDNIINSDWTKLISVVNDREVSMSEIIESKSSREYGNLIHRILSEIYTIKDVKKVIERLNNSGLFTDSELQIIEDIMYKVVGQAELSRYFDCERKMTVKNESEILLKSGEIIRPDKVIVEDDLLTIVDYKTGESKQADRDQMNKYANSLEELGYKSVKALLVYIDGEISIEKVKD